MDRTAGITFSFVFMLLGWAFAPFDTQPTAALVVSCVFTAAGLIGVLNGVLDLLADEL